MSLWTNSRRPSTPSSGATTNTTDDRRTPEASGSCACCCRSDSVGSDRQLVPGKQFLAYCGEVSPGFRGPRSNRRATSYAACSKRGRPLDLVPVGGSSTRSHSLCTAHNSSPNCRCRKLSPRRLRRETIPTPSPPSQDRLLERSLALTPTVQHIFRKSPEAKKPLTWLGDSRTFCVPTRRTKLRCVSVTGKRCEGPVAGSAGVRC
jgi:hypothetical protein